MIETLRKQPIVLLTILLGAFYLGRCTGTLKLDAKIVLNLIYINIPLCIIIIYI